MSYPSVRLGEVPPKLLLAYALSTALLLAVIGLWNQNRQLDQQVDILRADYMRARDRGIVLENELASRDAALSERSAKLELLEFKMEAVELQLEGIESLKEQVRDELELPIGSGPIGLYESGSSPVDAGGALDGVSAEMPPSIHEEGDITASRIDRARIKLSRSTQDLAALLEKARQQAAESDSAELAALPAGAAPGGAPAIVEPVLVEPENWPVRGRVSSDFGWRIFRGRPNYHTGIDVAVDQGTPVQATAHGTVVGSGWQPGYGWSVLVQHPGGYSTLYAHLSRMLVEVGDAVEPGGPVGLVGSSGNSTGPHLHYEIWRDGGILDPRPYMDGTGH